MSHICSSWLERRNEQICLAAQSEKAGQQFANRSGRKASRQIHRALRWPLDDEPAVFNIRTSAVVHARRFDFLAI
jgi:hypothetical protein